MDCEYHDTIDFAEFINRPMALEWRWFRDHYPTCRKCARAVAEFTAVARLLEDDGDSAASLHISDESIVMLATNPEAIDPSLLAELEAHLFACLECRETTSMLRRHDVSEIADPLLRKEIVSGDRPPRKGFLSSSWTSRIRDIFWAGCAWRPAIVVAAVICLVVLTPGSGLYDRGGDLGEGSRSERTGKSRLVDEDGLVASRIDLREARRSQDKPGSPGSGGRDPAIAGRSSVVGKTLQDGDTTDGLLAMASMGLPHYRPPSPLEEITRSVRYRTMDEMPALPRVLGPEHVGLTLVPSPSLYWYAPRELVDDVELLVLADDAPEPLVKITIEHPIQEGLHRLNLESLEVSLQVDVTYRWFVTVWLDNGTRRLRSGGAIRRIRPDVELVRALEGASPVERGHVLAGSGVWYDAFEFFSGLIRAHPNDPNLRQQRAALLEQVGIFDVVPNRDLTGEG